MIPAILGAAVGATVGWLVSRHLSRFTSGTCPILCNRNVSIPYFAFMGLLFALEWVT